MAKRTHRIDGRRRTRNRVLCLALGVVVLVYVFNASWRVVPSVGEVRLIAHRGVHQAFDMEGVQNDTCTATRIREPIVPEIENTLASMRAAFHLSADVVELDVHPTTDGKFAVFHDWTLECRTDGFGATRDHDMVYLKTLDIGYGYTADGGQTYPLRGTAIGLMPTLTEVFTAFPDGAFLINYKSRDAREGDTLAALLDEHPAWRAQVWGVYGGDAPVRRSIELIDGMRGYSRRTLKDCLGRYIALGWSGYVPDACHDTMIYVPLNIAPWLWGWPNLFAARMQANGSDIILRGDYRGGMALGGVDTKADVSRIPPGFSGYVWTNEIERIAPLVAGWGG